MSSPRRISLRTARRVAITAQLLAGPRPPSTAAGIVDVVRRLTCLQIDPTRAVERTERLVLWSRLGRYDVRLLQGLQEVDRLLFEHWAHEASLVLSEDWPISHVMMRTWPVGDGVVATRTRRWLADNDARRLRILALLRERGPLRARALDDDSAPGRAPGGWSAGRTVGQLLELMSIRGEVLVSARVGGQRLWDLAERCVPADLAHVEISVEDAVRRAAARSVRALGVCSARDVMQYFTRGRYPGIAAALDDLVRTGEILPVTVDGLRLDRYAHVDAVPEIDAIERGEWRPRTTLLSPFDNLIADRRRTQELWDFYFRLEIYTPQAKREFGYFVMPILHGDALVGRIDAAVDRKRGVLRLITVHLEPGVRPTRVLGAAVGRAARDLAKFVGATSVEVGTAPAGWAPLLSG
ncbi:MAG TPA: crosslink repair DNA glycosylase YcaQ family protein [Mycobacteriales bacterium]|nr:crosslink repair DNA glycosylase YcaQ family protein [Mycobacteriales bacterium]